MFRLTRLLPPTPTGTPRAVRTRSHRKVSTPPPAGLGWDSPQLPLKMVMM
nr:MAG TPA: hypothetical protein [Caudoviricetes sp.]